MNCMSQTSAHDFKSIYAFMNHGTNSFIFSWLLIADNYTNPNE